MFDLVGRVRVECAEVDGGVGLYKRTGVGRVLEAHQGGGGEDKVVVGRRRGSHVLNEKSGTAKPNRVARNKLARPYNH